MSHPHNPDTRIVLAPKRWLVDIGERPLESRGFGSLLRREGIRCASRSVATPMPTGAISSHRKHLCPATSAVISGSECPSSNEVCGQRSAQVSTGEQKNVMEGQFLPGLKTGVSLPI